MPTGTVYRLSKAHHYALLSSLVLLPLLAALANPLGSASAAAVPGPCPPPPPAPAAAPPGGVLPAPALVPAIPAPPEVVLACVGQYPITGASFNHWAKVARKATTPVHSGRRHAKTPPLPLPVATTIKEVMGFLISGDWVISEAARLGINVSEATVKRRFDHIRAEQFPHGREFRKFLRNSGQTIADLLLRVRLNILSTAIKNQVVGSAKVPNDREKTLSEFVKSFRARWEPQTVCVKAFTVLDCGSTQEPPL